MLLTRPTAILHVLLRLIGAVGMGILAAAVLVVVGFGAGGPQLDRLPPPVPEDAAYARVFLLTMEHIGRQPDRAGDVRGTLAQFNGLFRILARSNPDLRLRADIADGALRLDAAVRVPGQAWAGWINATAVVAPFQGRPELESLRLGRIALPPGPALRLLARALDLRLGAGAGEAALRTVTGLRLEDAAATVDLVLPEGSERLLSRNAISQLYGREMVSRARVAREVAFLERAVAEGRLERRGSYVPWLRTMIARAAEAPPEDSADALMAGFMALNYLCGSDHFVSLLLPPSGPQDVRMPPARPGCGQAALRDRVDLRRHFTTAATIKMMSARSTAITAGEAKELSDMLHGGFDFTDVAANNSGIRLAMRLDGATPADLRAVAAALTSEDAVIVELQGIPQIMGRAAFRTRFGDLDSPEYHAVLDEIEARIDRLAIHAGR